VTPQSPVPRLHSPTSQQLDGHLDWQEAAKATAALVVGKRRRKKANYVETKLAEGQPAGAASDGEGGGADDPPSDVDCVPTQDANSSDSDSDDDDSGQVRG